MRGVKRKRKRAKIVVAHKEVPLAALKEMAGIYNIKYSYNKTNEMH